MGVDLVVKSRQHGSDSPVAMCFGGTAVHPTMTWLQKSAEARLAVKAHAVNWSDESRMTAHRENCAHLRQASWDHLARRRGQYASA